jgi:ankyrin repeat protein
MAQPILIQLIRAGVTAGVHSHLEREPDSVHVRDDDGSSCVHWAALCGRLGLLQHLELHGAPLDARVEESGMTPMHWACTSGRLNVVRYLIDAGVDIDAADLRRTTPLMLAVQYHHDVLLAWLLKHGADPLLLDNEGDSALHWAAYKNNTMALTLICGADGVGDAAVTAQDNFGSNVLHLAATTGASGAAQWLMVHPEARRMLGVEDRKGRTPLTLAVEKGFSDVRSALTARDDDEAQTLAQGRAWLRQLGEGAGAWWVGSLAALDDVVGELAWEWRASGEVSPPPPSGPPSGRDMEMRPVAVGLGGGGDRGLPPGVEAARETEVVVARFAPPPQYG